MGTLSRKQLHCQCLELLRLKLCLSCNECHPGRAPQLVRKPVVKHEASSNSKKHRIYHHHQRSLPSPKRRDPDATPTRRTKKKGAGTGIEASCGDEASRLQQQAFCSGAEADAKGGSRHAREEGGGN